MSLRGTLLSHGYPITLCNGKASAPGWRKPITPETLAEREATYPDHTNTGAACGHLVGVDIDVIDRAHAVEIMAAVEAALGETIGRVGAKGAMLFYRNENPIGKITIASGKTHLFEILGEGQQCVLYGVHPDTGNEDHRPESYMGADPENRPLAALTEVTPDQLRSLAKTVADILTKCGYANVKISGDMGEERPASPSAQVGVPFTPAQLTAMLSVLDPDCSRDEWRNIAAALHAAPCTDPAFDQRDLFVRWSRGEVRA